MEIKGQQQGVVVCPGPNLAYFDKIVPLAEMTKHIYGNTSVISDTNRPNMFIKELKIYVDHLKNDILSFSGKTSTVKIKKWKSFQDNLLQGIEYYESLFRSTLIFKNTLQIINQLYFYKEEVKQIEF